MNLATTRLLQLVFAFLLVGSISAQAEVLVPAAGASRTIDQIKERGELRVGVAVAVPWLGFDPNNNQYFGASYEVGKAVARHLGVKLTTVSSGWDVIVAGIQGNHFELVIAPLFATEKRKKVVDFVNYTSAGTCYAVLKDSGIDSFADLDKKSVRIGTFTGTGNEQGIIAKYKNATIDSVVQAAGGGHRVEDVLTKRIDAAPFDDALAFRIAKEFPQVKIIPGGPEHCINNSDIAFPIGMAFSYGDPEFKKFLEAVVTDMRAQIDASLVSYSDPKYMDQ